MCVREDVGYSFNVTLKKCQVVSLKQFILITSYNVIWMCEYSKLHLFSLNKTYILLCIPEYSMPLCLSQSVLCRCVSNKRALAGQSDSQCVYMHSLVGLQP